MIAISINRLGLSFGTNEIFRDISFALNEGDRLGIIGVNGCGKSSLFKIIMGEYTPDEGSIFIAKDKSVGILRQDGISLDIDCDRTLTVVRYNKNTELCLEHAIEAVLTDD